MDITSIFKGLNFQPRTELAGFRNHAARRMDEQTTPGDFKSKVFEKLNQVNSIQKESENLTQQMLVDPDSVEAHEVMMALAEANMSLNITKAVLDRVIRAYRDITGTR
ncbi:MAG: flagellar hook-basal body complex protein FliE [Spirochaetaceae bacterium]|nr:flagellar hook-basal body complex protein FliE [Spirochaetaceae bacterium]